MARCGCGGACSCALTAGSNVVVNGNGTAGAPWVISSVTNQAEVRASLTSGDGTVYNPGDGSFDVCVSPNAGNALTRDSGGCLFVGTGAATVTTGPGVTGTGSPASPVQANVTAWPFACDVDAAGGRVFVGSTGVLKGEPLNRASRFSGTKTTTFSPVLVIPDATNAVIDTLTVSVTNPDPCRSALAVVYKDLQLTWNLPVGSHVIAGIDSDQMFHFVNNGTNAVAGDSLQVSKMTDVIVNPGETRVFTYNANAWGGLLGDGTLSESVMNMRIWLFSQP